jgi:cold-inducible RNA-binding protein
MTKRLYVGNLSRDTTETELTELFAQAGTIDMVRIIIDRATGRSKGFAFVNMNDGGDKAILDFNGKKLNGRPLTILDTRRSLYAVTSISVKSATEIRVE